MRSPRPRRDADVADDPFAPVIAAIGRGDLTGAAGLVERLLADLPADAPPELRARAHRLAATSWRMAGNGPRARTHLDAARAADPGPDLTAELDEEARAVAALLAGPATTGHEGHPSGPSGPSHSSDPAAAAELLDRLAGRLADHFGHAGPAGPGGHGGHGGPADQPPQVRSLLAAVEALGHGDVEAALDRLADASDHSRTAQDEVTYVVATLTWSELLEQGGNRLGSYGVLARAMATLRRGVGAEAARASLDTLEGAMRDRGARWGREEFAEVALEFRRRLTPPGTPADGAP
ncbi:hypothetical protein GCG21_02170 [Pseudactinotalea sp. HY160]|uniref:hypothetical protein n=1 Tax=Pseudactinotalea sp. HY160 TaxID=2654490 RepID=UPI00128BF830|nr:hypothetical protein [Pseudactinotalea sp. HY160]MPV48833.1 hypothetical protein [Pseudactinotalea sp. HY160]